jgi:O-antigen/teichoic acid export membrane protein
MALDLERPATALVAWLRVNRPYLQNTAVYLAERLLCIGLSFAVYIALARSYGPDLLGKFSYVQTVMLFAVPFLASGSEGIIVRDLVRQPKDTQEILGSSLLVLTATGLIACLLPLAALLVLNGNEPLLVTMALFTALGYVPSGFLVSELLLKKQQRATTILYARVGSAGVGAAIKLYLIYHGYPIQAVVLTTALEAITLTGLLVLATMRDYPPWHWRYSPTIARHIFRQSFPMMISLGAVMLFFRTNHLMLAYLDDFAAVGQYAVAFQTSQLFLVIPHVAFGAIYPKLVEIHGTNPLQYRLAMNRLYLAFTAGGYLIAFACFIAAMPLFHLVFGDRFDVAANVLVVLAIANIFNFSGAVRGRVIDILNRPAYHLWTALAGFVILVTSSWLVIPHYGPVGAAWCITAATAFSSLFSSFFLPQLQHDATAQLRALALTPTPATDEAAKGPT